ncbi:MAG TPA: chemotaxis protein CheB, partial [Fodinibius sp.]|nr:chemotaxis protein CheB [Fodinibius sp.]
LQTQTSLEVLQVNKKVNIEAEHVYVIPPQKIPAVGDNHLEPSEQEQKHGLASIDQFFRSLAEAKGEQAAGVILSGTGHGGTAGLRAIKEAGGLTIAQDPEEAQYPEMPQRAIEAGSIDFTLPVSQTANELIKYKEALSHSYIPDEGDGEEPEYTKEQLQVMVEEYETSNEELKTVNRELENKVEELDRANSDFKNLMEATEVGIIFVNDNFCLQQFTDSAKALFSLNSSDKGRPIADITHNLEYESLLNDIEQVHKTLGTVRKVVHSHDGRWYMARIRPYRSTGDKIEGVVLTFVEFTQLKEARRTIREQSYQQTLATLGVYALEQSDVQAVLKRAIDLACISLELDCAVIYALNKGEEGDTLEINAQAGCAKRGNPVTVDEKKDIGFAILNNEPTIVTDYGEEERFQLSPFLADEKLVSSIHIVVRGSEKTYGLFGFYCYNRRKFNEYEIDFLQVVANIIGLAIERYEVREDLKRALDRSEQYQREILSNNVSERWRLGQYLHDNLSQVLAAVKIMINEIQDNVAELDDETTGYISRVKKMIDENISGIRDLAHDIIPVDVEEEGFSDTLRLLVRQAQKVHEVKCSLEAGKVAGEIKNLEAATHLYHIIQEGVKNAAIHGKAKKINIHISKEDGHLRLEVRDDGVGLSAASEPTNGKGLRIIQHRVDLMNGTFTIEDVPEGQRTGTQLTVTVPLKRLLRAQGEEQEQ